MDEHDHILSTEISLSSGFERFDQAAMTVVKSWQCHPGREQGQPGRVVSLQSFNFRLHADVVRNELKGVKRDFSGQIFQIYVSPNHKNEPNGSDEPFTRRTVIIPCKHSAINPLR